MLSAAELASITTTVASALDVALPRYRSTKAADTYGHTTRTRVSQGNTQCNILKPSATQLQAYVDIIGAQRALVIRVMQSATVQEGDEFLYDGLYWVVNNMQDAESYTVTKEYLLTVVA